MTAPLRFATFLAPNMLPVYQFLADRIGQRLHRRVELVVGRSFDQFEPGRADLGVICGHYSDVIVRHDSPISRVEELKGPLVGLQRAGVAFRPHCHSPQPGRHGRPA